MAGELRLIVKADQGRHLGRAHAPAQQLLRARNTQVRPVRMRRHPHLRAKSTLGSLTLTASPDNLYRSVSGVSYSPSKTALNAITLAFALELEGTRIKVNAACPGYTATNLNNFEGTRSVEEGAREPVRLALLDASGPTGTYSNDAGPIPW
jgi:NAD(P)-dependent dehydrogenase (short-subunit alcohol dehydrogenase family)